MIYAGFHKHGIQEASGSTPLISTTKKSRIFLDFQGGSALFRFYASFAKTLWNTEKFSAITNAITNSYIGQNIAESLLNTIPQPSVDLCFACLP